MANTKVTGDLLADGTLFARHLNESHGITTSVIGEGTNLFYTDTRVGTYLGTYLPANGYDTATNIIASIVDSAPVTLDTLNELAAALGDDPNFATTVTNSLAGKLPSSSVSGTTNYLPKFTGISTIGNSATQTDATGNLMVGSANAGNAGTINVSVGAAGTTAGGLQLWAASNQTHFIQFGDGTTGAQVYSGYMAYAHGTDSLLFGTNGTDKMFLNASGNLGLGVAPSAMSAVSGVELVQGSQISSRILANVPQLYISSNIAGDSYAPTYKVNGYATQYRLQGYDGTHAWYTALSGTAGNAISFTQAMTLNPSGNLSIGNTNNTYKLDVSGTGRFNGTSASPLLYLTNTTGGTTTDFTISENVGLIINSYEGASARSIDLSVGGTSALLLTSAGAATFSSSVTAKTALITNPNSGDYLTITNTDTSISGGESIALVLDYTQVASSTGWKILSRYAGGNLQFVPNYHNGGYNTEVLSLSYDGTATFSSDVVIQNGKFLQAARTTGGALIDIIGIQGGNDTLQIKGGTSGAVNSINFYDTGGLIGTFYNGRLGIGVTLPAAKLDVAGTTVVSASIDGSDWLSTWNNTVTNGHQMYFGYGNAAGTRYGLYITGGNGSDFDFAVANKFYVNSNGNVGIGTTSPDAVLAVHGQFKIKTTNNDGNESRLYFNPGGAADPAQLYLYNEAQTNTIYITANGSSYFNGGNVGIGTTSPAAKLHVVGGIYNGYVPIGNLASANLSQIEFGERNYTFSCQLDNNWRTLINNIDGSSFIIEIAGGDAGTKYYIRYYITASNVPYGVISSQELESVSGGWNTGACALQTSSAGGSFILQFRATSYYSGGNTGNFEVKIRTF